MDARDARVNMVPEIPIAGAHLRRGFLLWLVTRGVITLLFLVAGTDVRKLSTLV
jgi:hypothetical protein